MTFFLLTYTLEFIPHAVSLLINGCIVFHCTLFIQRLFIQLPIDGHQWWVHNLAATNDVTANNFMHVSHQACFLLWPHFVAKPHWPSLCSFKLQTHSRLRPRHELSMGLASSPGLHLADSLLSDLSLHGLWKAGLNHPTYRRPSSLLAHHHLNSLCNYYHHLRLFIYLLKKISLSTLRV